MKRLLSIAVAIAAVTMFCQSEANAQYNSFSNGFQFGSGLSAGGLNFRGQSFGNFRGNSFRGGFGGFRTFGGGFGGGISSRDDLPYFAKFPPVYYSNIIARPVGISPFAAPSGIRPVELDYAPVKEVTKKNPFYDPAAHPVKATPKKVEARQKTTWIANPYMGTVVTK